MYRRKQKVICIDKGGNFYSGRQILLNLIQIIADIIDNFCCIGTRCLKNDSGYSGMSVYLIVIPVSQSSQLHISYIFQPQDLSLRSRPDHDIFKLLYSLQTTFIAHNILKRLIAFFSELSGRSFYILFGQSNRHISRHEFILSHYIWL